MSKKILIVDDAAFMRTVLRNVFESNGYEVVGEASNGKEALDQYEKVSPDLVTMDITMPKVDGIEGCRRITEKHPNAVVVMCTAMGQKAMVIDAIKAGAKDFIVKPFESAKILEVVQKLCG